MPWRPISTKDCKFTPSELARLNNIQGYADGLAKRLQDVVGEFIGAMNAVQYPTRADGTVPDQLRGHILARTAVLFLEDFPELKIMMTDARKKAGETAEEKLSEVAQRKFGAIESPSAVAPVGAGWNSENRLILRTHPVPPPAQQFPPGDPNQEPYANPAAPGDNG